MWSGTVSIRITGTVRGLLKIQSFEVHSRLTDTELLQVGLKTEVLTSTLSDAKYNKAWKSLVLNSIFLLPWCERNFSTWVYTVFHHFLFGESYSVHQAISL